MGNSLLIKSPTTSPVTGRPKFTRDPMIRPGTKFLFDFSRPYCHPNERIVAGSVASKVMKDLSADIPLTLPASGWSVGADGALSNAQSATLATIGSAGQFDMSAAEYEYVATYWFSITTGYLVTSTGRMLYLSSNSTTTNAQLWFGIGGSGRRPNAIFMGTSQGNLTSDISLDAPHMIAAHVKPGSAIDLYFDGVFLSSTPGAPADVAAALSSFVTLDGGPNRKTYRMSLCDIAASKAAEEAAGFNPNAILTGGQHILREWQFCNDLIGAAPKAAFV